MRPCAVCGEQPVGQWRCGIYRLMCRYERSNIWEGPDLPLTKGHRVWADGKTPQEAGENWDSLWAKGGEG